jgi:hypothetical protein
MIVQKNPFNMQWSLIRICIFLCGLLSGNSTDDPSMGPPFTRIGREAEKGVVERGGMWTAAQSRLGFVGWQQGALVTPLSIKVRVCEDDKRLL